VAGDNDALATGSVQYDLVLRTESTQYYAAFLAVVAMTIETGGQVGISTTPDYGLDVVGDK
jgi:hypothetical protein